MTMVDDLLQPLGLNLKDLNPAEQETFFSWIKTESTKEVTIDKLKSYLRDLIGAVERDLANTPEVEYYFAGLRSRPNRDHVQLKARLLNYLVIESFLISPDRARKALEEALIRIKKTV